MHRKDWKKDIFTIPNMLSLFRLLLIPVYVVLYLNAEPNSWTDHLIAAGVLAVSCLTDMIDGKIARRFNMISTTGKLLDPLADKATQLAMIICLLFKYPVLKWLIIVFLTKEIFQLIAAIITFRKGKVLDGALITGKISTTIVFTSLVVMVLLPQIDMLIIQIIAAVDIIALLVAMIDYARAFFTDNPLLHSVDEELGETK